MLKREKELFKVEVLERYKSDPSSILTPEGDAVRDTPLVPHT